MKLTALALAAGLGTRLRPFTNDRAKPSLPFLGVPLLAHSLRHLEHLPIAKLILNLHHAPDTVRAIDLSKLKLPLPDFSDETEVILGSAGALHKVMPHITTDQILLLNGDEVFLPQNPRLFEDAFEEHVQSGRLATLVTMPHPEVGKSFGGAWTDTTGKVMRFAKTAQTDLIGHHYVGYLFLNRRIEKFFKTALVEENILYETLTAAMQVGEEVACFDATAHWYETGQIELFFESTEAVLKLLERPQDDAGVQALAQFLMRFPQREVLIERSNPALVRRILEFSI